MLYQLTKEEINRYLGRKSWFKKQPKTESLLYYLSGIPGLNLTEQWKDSASLFYVIKYPKGIVFEQSKGETHLGIKFDDIKKIDIKPVNDETYELNLYVSFSKYVSFSFEKSKRSKIIPFFRFLQLKEMGDRRDDDVAKNEISNLKVEFEQDRMTECSFVMDLSRVAKKKKLLDINVNRIIWGEEEISISDAIGYSIGVNEVIIQGVSNFDYNVIIHRKEKPFYIIFNSLSYFHKVGEHTWILQKIDAVLFDLISRPIVAKWFDKFLNNESIVFKEFSLSKQGVLLKQNSPQIMIHWDEFFIQDQHTFRWRYTNTVFFHIDANFDRRGNMLFYFILWLQEDENRLLQLMGRNY